MHIKIDQNIQHDKKKLIVSFDLPTPGISVLQGANGVGKTTLFKYLKGVLELQQQAAFLDQLPLAPLALMTVADVFDCLQQERPEKVQGPWQQFALLDQIHITHLLDRPVSRLSGGENQLVKILLCLYQNANIYVMDEPFHFLDAKNYQFILELLQKLSADKGFFIIEHRNQDLLKLANKVYELTSIGIRELDLGI